MTQSQLSLKLLDRDGPCVNRHDTQLKGSCEEFTQPTNFCVDKKNNLGVYPTVAVLDNRDCFVSKSPNKQL